MSKSYTPATTRGRRRSGFRWRSYCLDLVHIRNLDSRRTNLVVNRFASQRRFKVFLSRSEQFRPRQHINRRLPLRLVAQSQFNHDLDASA